MEFFPMDVALPAGHRLGLRIMATSGDVLGGASDHLPSATSAPVIVHLDGATLLKLPLVERGEGDFFAPPR